MNREAEIERCAKDVLQMAEYGQIDSCTFKGNQVMEALRQALELPKQEPVAWMYEVDAEFDGDKWHKQYKATESKRLAHFCKLSEPVPLYTAPQEIKYEPMSDDERFDVYKQWQDNQEISPQTYKTLIVLTEQAVLLRIKEQNK